MESSETHCSWETVINFFILSIVRGTTPLMMYFAVKHFHSASLVVAVKCAFSVVMFSISALFLLKKSAVRMVVWNNMTEKSTYMKLFIVGFLQAAVPYLLLAYSVQYIPITLVGVFMVATPWCIYLIERSPIINGGKQFPTVLKIGMTLGIVGIIVMIIPVFFETAICVVKPVNITNVTTDDANAKELDHDTDVFGGKINNYCHPLKYILNSTLALIVVPLLWAASAVFWKKHQGNIHFMVASIGQNVFGCIIATVVWFIHGAITSFHPIDWKNKYWIIYMLYLGVITGWLGTLLVRNLFTKLGSKTINQVLTGIPFIAFIENCIFIKDTVTYHSYVLIVEMVGLILVTAGVFISNIPGHSANVRYNRDQGNLSEPLLNTEYTNEGLNAGLNQILQNQIHQYSENPEDEGIIYDENDEIEEPPFPPLAPDINKVNFPILEEIS